MKRNKVTCPKCGVEISKSNITKHLARHEKNPKSFIRDYISSTNSLSCQFCGKTSTTRSGLVNHERSCKLNPNRIPRASISGFNDKGRKAWNKGLTKESDSRMQAISDQKYEYYKVHDGAWLGKQHTEDQKLKISAARKTYLLQNPDKVPYLLNHSSKESYPEQYFAKLFKQEGIQLQREYNVGRYHIDFCSPDILLAIEIDGEQHYVDPVIVAHDVERTSYLESLGWKIIRIRWAHYKKLSLEKRKQIIDEIKLSCLK